MKKTYEAFKITGIAFSILFLVGLIALWLLIVLYPDPKEPNRNNWTEHIDISTNQDTVIHDVFRCAEDYFDTARLYAVDCSISPAGVEGRQIYQFCVPANGKLPNGTLMVWVDMEDEKIFFVEMDYDRSGRDFETAMDEKAAKETQKRVESFYQNQEWDDADIDDIRLTWYSDAIYIWTKDKRDYFLWEKYFEYSNGEYVEVIRDNPTGYHPLSTEAAA